MIYFHRDAQILRFKKIVTELVNERNWWETSPQYWASHHV